MGLNPTVWGPQGWHFIHATAMTFPPNPTDADKQNYQAFFNSLEKILPCELCRENFKQKIAKMPPPYTNGKEMFEWSVDIHNQVNKENTQPELTYEQAAKEFSRNSKKFGEPIMNMAMLIRGAGIALLAYGLIKKNSILAVIGTGFTLSSIVIQIKERRRVTN